MKASSLSLILALLYAGASCKPKPPAAEPPGESPATGSQPASSRPADQSNKPAPEDTSAHDYLLERLRSPDKFVRYKAVFDAKKLKPEEATRPIVAALKKLYNDPQEQHGTREVAGRALGRFDAQAALAAWRASEEQSWDVLIEIGPAAIGEIRKGFQESKEGELELMAFIALTEIVGQHPTHPECRGAIPLLLQALDQEYDPRLKPLAARALSAFGESLNKELAGHLGGPLPQLRKRAALAAGLLDQPDAVLMAALERASRDKDPAVRKEVRSALKKHAAKKGARGGTP